MFERDVRIPQVAGDSNHNLRITHLFGFLMEMGNLHSDNVGMPSSRLTEMGYTWMLYQLKYKIVRLPKSKELVKFKTWVSKWDKIKSTRETNVYDEDGNLLVASTTVWLVVDIEKNRAIRVPEEIRQVYEIEGNANFESMESFNKEILSFPGEGLKVYKSDIDYNNHVNSGVYLRWIVDSLEIPDENLREVEIYYGSQVFYDSQVEIRKTKIEDKYYHQIICDGKPAVYGMTRWES